MKKLIYICIITIFFNSCANKQNKLPDSFDFGKTLKGKYENIFFNLEIDFNPSWSVQDKQQVNNLIEVGTDLVAGENKNLERIIDAAKVNTAYLLTIFKYEVGSPVEFNPSFMAVAENTKNFPGVKNGSDYLFHAKKLLKQTQIPYRFEKEVYEKIIGNATFYVLESKLDQMGLSMTQEYMTTVTRGFSLSFIVSHTNEEEKKELYKIIDKIKI